MHRYVAILIATLGTLAAGALGFRQYGTHYTAFGSGFVVDDTSVLFAALVLLATLGSVVLYGSIGEQRHVAAAVTLMLWSASGAMLMAGAGNLMTIFFGLELLSLALYTLCGLADRPGAHESALKYSHPQLHRDRILALRDGLALRHDGKRRTLCALQPRARLESTLLDRRRHVLRRHRVQAQPRAVPHLGTRRLVGAPLPVTAFISVATKAGVLAVLVRVCAHSSAPHASGSCAVWVVAGISMIAGNVGMLAQRDLKRMLAYSGIAQIGYVLTAVAGGYAQGFDAALYYFAAYSLINLGAFAVAAMLSAIARRARTRQLLRSRLPPAVGRIRDDGLPARHGGFTADGRVPREDLHSAQQGRDRLRLARRIARRRDRDLALRVRAHRPRDVRSLGARRARRKAVRSARGALRRDLRDRGHRADLLSLLALGDAASRSSALAAVSARRGDLRRRSCATAPLTERAGERGSEKIADETRNVDRRIRVVEDQSVAERRGEDIAKLRGRCLGNLVDT